MVHVEVGSTSDLDVLARVVARSFASDPLMEWLLADADSRYSGTLRWWTPIVARYLAADRALVNRHRNACLLWHYSEEHLQDAPGQPSMREVVAQLVPPERLREVKAALAVFPRLRPQEEHVYVHAVATDPNHQSHGHGGRLVDALPTRATEKGLFCLESTNARNHPFYVRNGFRAGARETLPGSGVIATAFARREAETRSRR